MAKRITRWRSSRTGKFVPESYGKNHKPTTEKERIGIRPTITSGPRKK